ncbi:MAG: 30S ribosomal protein S5 [Nanoarchaeota archaeon]
MVKEAEELPEEAKELVEEVPEPEGVWAPKTSLGRMVKEGKITDIEEIFDQGLRIMEPEVVNVLLPDLEEDLLLIGQAKGKFGGGQRRIFRQTQKKTREGNKIEFTTCAVVGNKNGYVGIGIGKSKETVPARDKAKRKARLNIIRIRRGSGSWESAAVDCNSIPFAVEGRCGSVRIKLMPAPKGKGLCVEKECAKILRLAGIRDVFSRTEGQTKTKLNLIFALLDALKKLSEVKIQPADISRLAIVEGKYKETAKIALETSAAGVAAENGETN